MRRWWMPAVAACFGAALLSSAPAVLAQSSVLPSPTDTSELRELQVAWSIGPARSTLWFGARLYGASDQVFVVVPAPPGASIDTASDAWFEALRMATNTRVLPPATSAPACGSTKPPADGSYELIGDTNHTPSLAPDPNAAVRSFSELVVWAQGAGLDLSFDQISKLADLDVAGYRFVTMTFEPSPGETVLRTIRVTAPGATPRVPLLLSRAGATAARAFVWVMGEGKATPTGLPATTVDTQKLAWTLGDGASRTNYDEVWSSGLDKHDDQAWVIDAAAHALLLSTTPFASGKASIPSVASTYFARAAGYGEGDADYQPCVMRVEALDSAVSKVADACAPGALAVVPWTDAGGCTEQPGPGEIDPAQLRCGGAADDFALAFAGMSPSKIWLTRWTGRIGAWQSRAEEPVQMQLGAPVLPVAVCPDWDTSDCQADAGPDGAGGSSSSPDAGSPSGSGGGSVPGGNNPYVPSQEQPSDEYTGDSSGNVYVETSCWGDTTSTTPDDGSSSEDSCGGDSSSSSSSAEGDSACGGDSSSSSQDDGACAGDSSSDGDSACGGDSSSSSSSSGDSCSGDSAGGEDSACSGSSSSSSSSGSSCSGGSSSSSGSSGCSGGGSSSGGSDCSMSSRGRRGGKLPMSAMTLLIVTLLWPLRRARRAAERAER